MENPETLLLELEEFNKKADQDDQIPQNLENFIEFVSKTGTYIYPWPHVRKLYLKKLNNVMNNLQSCMSTSVIKERIMERMQSFTSAPFTIQRISELLLKPNNHYNRVDKFLRGLEKCVMVVTTVDPNGSKIFIELSLANGVMSNSISPVATPTRPLSPVSQMNQSNEPSMLNTSSSNDTNNVAESTANNITEETPSAPVEACATLSTTITTSTVYVEEQTIISNEQISMSVSEKIEETVVTNDEPMINEPSEPVESSDAIINTNSTTNENTDTHENTEQPISVDQPAE